MSERGVESRLERAGLVARGGGHHTSPFRKLECQTPTPCALRVRTPRRPQLACKQYLTLCRAVSDLTQRPNNQILERKVATFPNPRHKKIIVVPKHPELVQASDAATDLHAERQ